MTTRCATLLLATFFGMALAAEGARAAGPFDGVYTGSIDLTSNPKKLKQCPPTTPLTVKVVDSAFAFSWNGSPVDAKVGPDGSFAVSGGRIGIDGKIAGKALDGSLRGPACTYSMSAKKS